MEEVQAYYNEKARNYDASFDSLGFRLLDTITWKHLKPYVPTSPDTFVLDAGGGTGRWATLLAKKGCHVVLIDASEEMLKVAAEKIRRENLQQKITIEKGDMTRTGHIDKSFDMIFCEQTLFLFRQPDVLMKEMKRVLKDGGRLIVSAQNRYAQCLASLSENPAAHDVDRISKLLLRKEYSTMTKDGRIKIYTWTPDEFRGILERNGFQIEKIIGKGTTIPLRIPKDVFMKKDYSEDLFQRILEFELAVCEEQDALALAGHLQAIARKP